METVNSEKGGGPKKSGRRLAGVLASRFGEIKGRRPCLQSRTSQNCTLWHYPSANTASDVNQAHTWVPWRPLCIAERLGELGKRYEIGLSATYIAITLNVYHLSTKSA